MEVTGKSCVPVTSASVVRHYANNFLSHGATIERLLETAGICPEYLDVPDAVVPLDNAYRFAELACHSLQTQHLGLHVGLASSPADFGRYGRGLLTTTTLGEYLARAAALFNALTSGERLWLSEHGTRIGVNISSPGDVGLGMYQSHLGTMAVTLRVCREVMGPSWSPDEIGFAYRSREKMPYCDLFAESRIQFGLPHSFIMIPRSAMALRLPQKLQYPCYGDSQLIPLLPSSLVGLAEKQIEAFIAEGRRFHIESVAESLAISKRTLQRAIGGEGLTYSQLVAETRLRRAIFWLDHSDKPVTEIALELGYTEGSNFTRAFRRRTGMSPRAFRQAAS
jgi:AraC-like DNA-binding protein